MTNYIKLKPGLLYQNYVFFDVEQYYADNLFIQYKIKVTFLREYQKEDIPYLAIFCKVKKQDVSEFEIVMKELANKMIICGYTEYEQFCERFINDILPDEENL